MRHAKPSFLALAGAMLAASSAASAQTSLIWQAPQGICPSETQTRGWLAHELSGALAAPAPVIVIATASHSVSGWGAILRVRRGEATTVSAVHGPDCATVARLAVQEIVFDTVVLPDRTPAPVTTTAPEAPAPPAPPAPPALPAPPAPPAASETPDPPSAIAPLLTERALGPRWSLDLGAGVGGAFVGGSSTYIEQFTNSATGQTACGAFACFRTIDPGVATTWYGFAALRWHPTPRVALALTARLQADAASWTISAPTPGAPSKSNPLANLLISARAYYALSRGGFAARGATSSLFAGFGVGQISAQIRVPAASSLAPPHLASGLGEAHVGARYEYGLTENLHVGLEVTAHLMFPEVLLNLDAALVTGAHF